MLIVAVSCSKSVESEAESYCKSLITALLNHEDIRIQTVSDEYNSWYETLSDEDKGKVRSVSEFYANDINVAMANYIEYKAMQVTPEETEAICDAIKNAFE